MARHVVIGGLPALDCSAIAFTLVLPERSEIRN
jgi:hypothetical protein